MADIPKITLCVDGSGRGSITVNGLDLSFCVKATRIVAKAGEGTLVEIDIPLAHVTADLEAALRVYIVNDVAELTDESGVE